MVSGAAALVAGIIDRIEGRPCRTGRPPLPTIAVVETLHFFVREGVQWREPRAAAGRACGSTLRRRPDEWSAAALLRQVHVALIQPVRAGPGVAAWDVVVDSCSVRAKRRSRRRNGARPRPGRARRAGATRSASGVSAGDPRTYNLRSLVIFLENLRALEEGRRPPNLVDLGRGY